MPFLTLLSRLALVDKFYFNMLSLFPSIVRILSSQAISFQILFYALSPRFFWSAPLSFPSYFKLHNLYTIGDSSALCTCDLHNIIHFIPNNISQHPTSQSHLTGKEITFLGTQSKCFSR